MNLLLVLSLLTAMQAGTPSSVRIVSREVMTLVDAPKQAVARSAAEWAALWRHCAGDRALPAVDFGSRTVVAVFLGSRSSAGYAAEITGVRRAGGVLIVEWQERRPQRGEVSAQVLTSPGIVATVPKFAGAITFEQVGK